MGVAVFCSLILSIFRAAKEVLPGRRKERHRPHGSADSVWPLALGGVPQDDPEADGRQVLVLQTLRHNDPLTRAAPLSEREVGVGKSGGVGGKEPGRCLGAVSQP
jgi:hypothetical protein